MMSDEDSAEGGRRHALGAGDFSLSGSATLRVRRNFAVRHLSAADHFADEVLRLELENSGLALGQHYDLCTWNATAAIILSFSAIEAAVDEIEVELGLREELVLALEKSSTLNHASALLAHCGKPPFDRGVPLYQNVELLRQIRNALVHAKAEWDDEPGINRRLSTRIVGAGLPLSPFWADPSQAFPHGCMSAGVARWAAGSARSFIRELRNKLELRPIA